jgi:hypothetical protein
MAARSRSQRSVLPSISVKTKETVPLGIDAARVDADGCSFGVALTLRSFDANGHSPVDDAKMHCGDQLEERTIRTWPRHEA